MTGNRLPQTLVDGPETEAVAGEAPLREFLIATLDRLERAHTMGDVEQIRRDLRLRLHVLELAADPQVAEADSHIRAALAEGKSESRTIEELREQFAEHLTG